MPAGDSKTAAEEAPRIHPTYPRGCTGTSRGRHRQRTGSRAVGRGPLLCTTWISLSVQRGRNWTRKWGRNSKRFDISVWGCSWSSHGRRSVDRPDSDSWNSPAVAAPRRCTMSVIAGRPPARLPFDRVEPAASFLHRMPHGRATAPAVVISRLTAQMKPQSSRAIAVTATVLGLPLRISAR